MIGPRFFLHDRRRHDDLIRSEPRYVHAVETVKFVAAWSRYETAVRMLAMGTASDPGLGD